MKTSTRLFVSLMTLGVAFGTAELAGAEELRARVEFERPVGVETPLGEVLLVPGADLYAAPGEPLLPRITVNFVLPCGHEMLEVRIEDADSEPLPGVHQLAPGQLPVPLTGNYPLLVTQPDPSVYASDDQRPGERVVAGPLQYKYGYALLPVTVYPLAYRPRSGLVDRLVSASIVVTTGPGGRASQRLRALDSDLAAVKAAAIDSSALASYPGDAKRGPERLDPGTYEYLIVTPEAFVELGGEDSLEALRDAREAGGMPANIVTLEWIRANYEGYRPDGDQDDATRIRDFLADAYDEWSTSYVLLVGDADSDDVGGESGDDLLQVRKFYVDTHYPDVEPDYIPADLYYSCLDGTFDHDADGVYGEHDDGPDGGEVDLLAELYVGRAPVDSPEEVRNFVAKTLAYDQAAGAWLKDVLMVGELLWNDPYDVWGADSMDQIAAGSSEGGYTTQGFESLSFYEISELYDRDLGGNYSWGASDLMPLLDNGPHVVNHLGHSDVTYNMRLMNNEVDTLINAHPFFVYTQGCLPGAFDNEAPADQGDFVYSSDCIAEHFVVGEHGAFAMVANSRYGWGSFMSDSPSQRFHRQYFDAFFGEGMATLGEALVDSKEDNASAFSDNFIRWVGFESNLLGDPALVLKKSLNTDQALLGLYPPELDFVALVGDEEIEAQVLRVRNDGVDTLTFTAESDQDWLTVTPESGTAPEDLQLSVDPSALEPGLHEAIVTITSPEAANSPQEVGVGFFLVEVSSLVVPHIQQAPSVDGVIDAGEYDGGVSLVIDPQQNGDVILYMAVVGEQLYLAIEDMLDRTADDFDRMTLMFDRDLDGLWPAESGDEGMYIVAAFMGGANLFMPIFNSGAGYEMDMHHMEQDPAGFDGAMSMTDYHRVYEIALDLEWSHLDIGPVGEFGMFVSSTNSQQMGAGTVTGNWPLIIPEMDDQRFFGHVSLKPQGPWLYSEPRRLVFEAVIDRPSPDPLVLSVLDVQGGNLDFSAQSSEDWLSVSTDSGQTPEEVTITVDHAGLAVNFYTAELTFESDQAGNEQHVVPVGLLVLPPPARLSVEPESFDIGAAVDADNPVLQLTVHNVGGREMTFMVEPDQGWLDAVPSGGQVAPGASMVVEVEVEVFYIERGVHQAEIVISSEDAENSPLTVPVQVEVLGPTPVPPVESLGLEAFENEIHLSWQVPDSPIVSGVMIRRAPATPPDGPEAGEEIYDGLDEQTIDSGLQAGYEYCYSAFAHDASGRFAEPASGCQTTGENEPPPVPRHIEPPDNSLLDAAPTLVVAEVVDPQGSAVQYTFELRSASGDELLDSGAGEVSEGHARWQPAIELEPGAVYTWRVEAADDRGASSGFSTAWTFGLAGGDEGGGCGCGSRGKGGETLWLAGLLAWVLTRRRRRR